jgi:hypothetical protein
VPVGRLTTQTSLVAVVVSILLFKRCFKAGTAFQIQLGFRRASGLEFPVSNASAARRPSPSFPRVRRTIHASGMESPKKAIKKISKKSLGAL